MLTLPNLYKQAGIYTRLSTEDKQEENLSIPNQLRICKEIALTLGASEQTITHYNEGIESGKYTYNRPEYNRLCADALQRKIDFLIVKEQDRLGRNPADIHTIISNFKALLIPIYDQRRDDITKNTQVTGIKSYMDAYWIQKGQEAVGTMFKLKQASGDTFGRPPYGYKANHKIIHGKAIKMPWKVNEKEMLRVKAIYDDYAYNDLSIVQIAEKYEMFRTSILVILSTHIYNKRLKVSIKYKDSTGKEVLRVEERSWLLNDNYPKIIDDKTFNLVQEKLSKRRRYKLQLTNITPPPPHESHPLQLPFSEEKLAPSDNAQ